MTHELRDKFFGQTLDEWIALVPGELEIDEVSLWGISSFARQGFGLSGDALKDCMRRCILGLLDRGAKPVVHVANAIHGNGWLPVDYGPTPDRIADAIIAEQGLEPGFRVWFALPEACLEP